MSERDQAAKDARIEWREQVGIDLMHAMRCTHDGADYGDKAVCVTCFDNTQRIGAIVEAQAVHSWDQGYRSGKSNAMRRMSDEPQAPATPNPYADKASA